MIPAILFLLGLAAASPGQIIFNARSAPALSPSMRWDYPLGKGGFTPDQANASVPFYSVDLENTTAQSIHALQDMGHYIACYFSAGSREDGRPDYNDFPPEAVGNKLKDWPKERWVDVRNQKIRDIMIKRIDLAAQKGCNGIDPDNIDGYQQDNNAGIKPNMTSADAIDYVKFLCAAANERGMQCGLKNGGDIARELVRFTDWDINEECVAKGNECGELRPFVDAGKPVFHVEYFNGTDIPQDNITAACAPVGFSSIIKHMQLNDSFTIFCD